MGRTDYETLSFYGLQRLTGRAAADAVFFGEGLLVDLTARRQLAFDDAGLYLHQNLIG